MPFNDTLAVRRAKDVQTTASSAPQSASVGAPWTVLAAETHTLLSTVRSCRNWGQILGRVVAARLGVPGCGDIEFRLRDGTRVVAPGYSGGWGAVFEVLISDAYRVRPLARRLGPLTIIDIGAHIGTFPVRVTMEAALGASVCVEASPVACSYLRRNLAANGASDRVTIVNAAAVGQPAGLVTMYECGEAHWATSMVPHPGAVEARVPSISFAEIRALAGARVDVCKLDCEGAEYDIVLGSPASSWNGIQNVVLEYHPIRGRSSRQLRTRLESLGFQMIWHEANRRRCGLGTAAFTRKVSG